MKQQLQGAAPAPETEGSMEEAGNDNTGNLEDGPHLSETQDFQEQVLPNWCQAQRSVLWV